MLKGYTKIELTNVHTGEKEVVEKHNIVTNFLNDYVAFSGLFNDQKAFRTVLCPLYEKGLGGIQLLKEKISEDASAYRVNFLSSDAITGCGYNGVNSTSDVKVGSKNITESQKIENGYKLVWDFSTSQANGDISTIGLCRSEVCRRSGSAYAYPELIYSALLHNDTSDYFDYIVEYDFSNETLTCIKNITATKIKVYKIKLELKSIGLNAYAIADQSTVRFENTVLLEKDVECPFSLNTSSYYSGWGDGFDGYYYYFYFSNSKEQYIARMKKDTLQIDELFGMKKINFACDFNNSVPKHWCIANSFLYFGGYDKKLRKVNLSNPVEVIELADGSSASRTSVFSDGKYVYSAGNIIFPDDSFTHYNFSSSNQSLDGFLFNQVYSYDYPTFLTNDGKFFRTYGEDTIYFGVMANHLCTINNLEETVTKTPDKTMKITYTITEVEDE